MEVQYTSLPLKKRENNGDFVFFRGRSSLGFFRYNERALGLRNYRPNRHKDRRDAHRGVSVHPDCSLLDNDHVQALRQEGILLIQ